MEKIHSLTSMQKDIWLEQTLNPDIPFYNIGMVLQIDGAIDIARFEKALNHVVAKNDALRLVLRGNSGIAQQQILSSVDISLTVVDLSDEVNGDEKARRHIHKAFIQPFDLAGGLLWEWQLIRARHSSYYWLHRYHHLVTDGYGVQLITCAVVDAYNKMLAGETISAEPGPSYLDCIAEDQNYLTSSRYERSKQFWCERFKELPPPLFPQYKAKMCRELLSAEQVLWSIERSKYIRIRDIAAAHGFSTAHFMLALFSTYFARVNNLDEIVIGVPVHNRTTARHKRSFGMFASMIPVGIRIDRSQSFIKAMRSVAEELKRSYRHQRFPIADINRSLKLAQAGRTQLFDLSLAFVSRVADLVLGDVKMKLIPMHNGFEKTPLAVFIRDYHQEDDVVVEFNYNVNNFERDAVEKIKERIVLMADALLEELGNSIDQLPLLDTAEHFKVVKDFNATEAAYPQDKLIHERFEDQVKASPEAVAVVFEDQSLSYGELNRRANQLARYLRQQGVGPDQLVGICVERSLEMVVGLLGILKAGGAYVPIDPAYPSERIEYMLQDAAPNVVLTQARLKEALPETEAQLITLDGDWTQIASESDQNLKAEAPGLGLTARHLAYVIYTSGSTGQPKGVMNEHSGIVNRLQWMQDAYGLTAEDRVLQKTPFSFDVSVWEFFWPLLTGARLVVARPQGHQDPAYLRQLIKDTRVTTIHFVPSMLQVFLEQGGGSLCEGLRHIVCSGEELPVALQNRCLQAVPQVRLHNLYGPTEAAIDVTYWECRLDVEASRVPIGRPIANTQIYILDGQGQPVPIGVSGELYIGGAGVARGYLHRPELTAERFIKNTFSNDPDARLYKTGDLGRWRADGSIDYLGRNDHQVKLRGFRIELGEIEAWLSCHPQVKEAIVLVREDQPGDKRLVAYITMGGEEHSANPSVDIESLRAHLKAVLPEYMVPSAFVNLESLPLTPNGKLDRQALPAPDQSALQIQPYEAPQGEVEQTLAAIWQDLLQVEEVGRQDNFFDLGGHSLLIVQVIERLHQAGLQTDIRNIFNNPVLANLAVALSVPGEPQVLVPPIGIPSQCEEITPEMLPLIKLGQEHIDRIVLSVPGGAGNIQDIYPLAPLQEGILFHHMMSQQGDAYVLYSLLSVETRGQLDAFLNALQSVIDRHDILRSAVLWKDLPKAVQAVYRHVDLPVQTIELDPARDPQEQLQAIMAPERLYIDLQQAPLLRVQIAADVRSPRWFVMLQLHHIVSDHVSLEIILSEVLASLGEHTDRLAEPVAYREFVAHTLANAECHDAEAYFKSRLADVDEPTLPFGIKDVLGDGSRMREARQDVDNALAKQLRRHARRLGVSAATLFHVVYALVVARSSGREDVVFGSVLSGRLHGGVAADRMVGMFINTLPLRLSLKGARLEQLIRDTHSELVELLVHEQASLALAQRCSAVPAQTPLFSAVLNYRHSVPLDSGEMGNALGITVLGAQERTNYPFALSVDDLGEDFSLTAQTDSSIDPNRVIGYMQTALDAVVHALDTAPESDVLQLAVLPESERQQVLEGFNATEAAYPQDTLIHELFEAQAKAAPEAVAVVFEEQSLSYGELNRRSNQLAHYLHQQGVEAGEYIPLLMSRSVPMLVAQLAVLKCGCAYVPIDPDFPQDRRVFMIEDCHAKHVIGAQLLQVATQSSTQSAPESATQSAVLQWIDPALADEAIADCSAHNLNWHGDTQRPAYVMYTSGSTGTPKGVIVPHRAVNRLVINNGYARLEPSDCIGHCSNPAFDASTFEIWGALLNGARVLIVPQTQMLEPQAFARVLKEKQVTVLWLTVGLFNQYADALGSVFTQLRYLLVGGDVLDAQTIRRVLHNSPPRHILNGYGPTETTTFAATYQIETVAADENSIPIGRPIANTRIYILDSQGQPVPIGVGGELCIGGAGVARGYLNQPELTDERFITDTFSKDPEARLYKTGDLGRWRADGAIEYLGRNDHQVKLRGFRIELGEIEAQLSAHPQVKEAVVLAREDRPGDKRLVAYVTTQDEGQSETPIDIEALRTHLQATLPEYMVPSAYVTLASLPLTPNGKLDRRALPAPDQSALQSQPYEAPQGEIEQTLAAIWQELLNVERVGRQDNFFDLGGHSLLIVQLIERLRQAGLQTDIRNIFNHPVFASQAIALSGPSESQIVVPPNLIPAQCEAITPEMLPLIELEQAHIDHIVQSVPGGTSNVQDIYPLAPLQEGILFHHMLSQQGDAYVLPTLLSVETRGELDAFLNALQSVIDRHDILRSAVLWKDLPQAVQVVYRHVELPVKTIELDPAEDAQEQLQALMAPERLYIDLQQAPLLRVQVAADAHSSKWFALLQFHHIVSDHVSQEIVISEVLASLGGNTGRLPEPVAYREFVAHALANAERHDAEAFFTTRLADIDEPTLPFGLKDVLGDGSRMQEARQNVDSALAKQVRHHARRLGVSAATLFHVVYALVVARSSGREDVVFGSVLAGRLQGGAGADRVVGMFINTLPLRLSLQGTRLEQLIIETHSELVELLLHEQATLALAQRCSALPAQTPLFSAVLNYRHSASRDSGEMGDALGITILGGQERTNYPFVLSVDDLGEGFSLTAQTDSSIDPNRVIAYVQTTLDALVHALDTAPESDVLQLAVLPESERQHVIKGFNATETVYPQGQLIHQQFEAQAKVAPDTVALTFEEQSLNYGDLNRRANQLARYLRQQGVGPDTLVGICVERSLKMVVGLLGILKAGGAYVPIDPAYPSERIEYMLKDAAPQVVLTQARLKAALPDTGAQLISLDSDWSQIASQSDKNLKAQTLGLTPAHLAYVIYTSGSTGQPKGVMIAHANAVNLICWAQSEFSQRMLSHTLFSTSINFDLAVYECFVPLSVGATVHIVANALELLHKPLDVTLINTVPSSMQSLADAGALPKTTQVINLAGEPLKRVLVEQLFTTTEVDAVCNLYGPSETTTYSTWVKMEKAKGFEGHIGRPIANTQIYILDSQGQAVPVGVPGELYIGGAGLARGYLNNPRLTAEKFVVNPFEDVASSRLYKTGDLVRYTANGDIEFLGRLDNQVKVRGFRIELGEIENALLQHPAVAEAVVIADEPNAGDKRLLAYIVPMANSSLDVLDVLNVDALRSFLRRQLPDYMIPSFFMQLNGLPLTVNGKIDRRSLPAPEMERAGTDHYVAPRTELEGVVAKIWSEVLGVEQVSIHDNFFELGGHSISVTRIVSKINNILDVDLALRQVFEFPTIAQLVTIIKELQQKHSNTESRPPLVSVAVENKRLPSFSQQRLLFLEQLEHGRPVYNIPIGIQLNGNLNVGALKYSLSEIMLRHKILRTVFQEEKGQFVQTVNSVDRLPFQEVDLSQLSQVQRENEKTRLVKEQVEHRFDLAREPLIRCSLLKLAEEEYLLILVVHHVAADGWSLGVLVEEMAVLYPAFNSGMPSPLSPLSIQYADFAYWQRSWLQEKELERQLGYWQEQLADMPQVLSLPADYRRPAQQSYRGAKYPVSISPAVTKRLHSLGQDNDVTLFMTLLSVFQVLLYRYSGQKDFAIGSPIANRTRVEIEPLIGLFVNTLVLRANLTGNPSFQQLLTRTKEVTLGAYTHQDMPFERLVDELQPRRDLSHTPLFQVMFALQNAPIKTLHLPELTLKPIEFETGTTKFDLYLQIGEHVNGGLWGSFEYNSDIFSETTIVRLADSFIVLLDSVITDPSQSIGSLALLGKGQRQQLLLGSNDTKIRFADQCVHQLIEAQVEISPEAVAVVFEGDSLKYSQLNARANQLANQLRILGVGPDVLVAVCLERSVNMVVALLAILKAGGAYVPLDPSYPKDRLAFMLEDSRALLVLTQSELKELLADTPKPLLCLTPEGDQFSRYSVENPENLTQAQNLAYVIYTSGSTGTPKGVQISHGAIGNRLQWMQSTYRLSQDDCVLQKTPFGFDVSVWEFFWPLMSGARLVVARPDGHRDSDYLVSLINTESVTTIHFVPPMLQVFLNHSQSNTCNSLKRVICSGETLGVELQRRLFECLDAELYNLYGPTEAAVDVSAWTCQPGGDKATVPIGRPIANIQLYILDENLNPVPIGVPGELHISGAGLARGYLNRPQLTAEKFISNPFSTQPGSRMYKTGDLARFLDDGAIEFLGRMDNQVKVRGYRIELGEIESVLLEQPEISEAAVLLREDIPTDKRLVAYVVSTPMSELSCKRLRGALKNRLPEYMVPAAFVILENLPVTVNGKLDRRKLPAPERPIETKAFQAPRTDIERYVVNAWSEVLNNERIGIHEDFFELGGNSLLSMQVVARLKEDLQRDISVKVLFEYPVLMDFAAALTTKDQKVLGEIVPVPPQDYHPVSHAQRRIWFLVQLDPGNTVYNIPAAFRLRGMLQVHALKYALQTVVDRHCVLRTTFVAMNNVPMQWVHENLDIKIPEVDLSTVQLEQKKSHVQRLLREEVNSPFNLETGPLIRAKLVRLSVDEHLLLFSMHHIIADAWSMKILVNEVSRFYAEAKNFNDEFRVGNLSAADLEQEYPALPVQYIDYSQWQNELITQGKLLDQEDYWLKILGDEPPDLELPNDKPRPRLKTFKGAKLSTHIDQQLYQRLLAFCAEHKVTLFMCLVAIYQLLLSRLSGQTDIAIGTPIAGRHFRQIKNLIGFFVNTLVLRSDMSIDHDFKSFLQRVRTMTIDAYAHQDYPFDQLVDKIATGRDLGRQPLFNAMLVLQDHETMIDLSRVMGMEVEPMSLELEQAKFDLTLGVTANVEGLDVDFEYNSDLFEQQTIQRWLGYFRTLLEAAINSPTKNMFTLPMLGRDELYTQLVKFNSAPVPEVKIDCLHRRFERQAKKTPMAIAAWFNSESITYDELNRRANQLAHYLLDLGVKPEVLVGICVERSIDLLVGILGILKAGGAYLPIDPDYPLQRQQFILEDTGASFLITNKRTKINVKAYHGRTVCLDKDKAVIGAQAEHNPDSDVKPSNLAYVIYTSGSTGKPKGAMLEHANVARLLDVCGDVYDFKETDVWTMFHSYSFDFSVWELFGALTTGGQLVVVPREVAQSPTAFMELLAGHKVTILNQTPSSFVRLLDMDNEQSVYQWGKALRYIIFGGETLDLKVLQPWYGRNINKHTVLVNMYGITETTVHVTYRILEERDVFQSTHARSVGRPLPDLQAYVLDSHLNPVPIGVVGELHIGGAGLARGYLNRPNLTSKKFIQHTINGSPVGRLYKTGDLVRYLPDGNLEYIGRGDHQVKIRGYRIELGEIEAALVLHPEIKSAVVLTEVDRGLRDKLVAYYVAEQAVSTSNIRSYLSQSLPDFMVPTNYIQLSKFPVTDNGKLDRTALLERFKRQARPEMAVEFVTPHNSMQKRLANIWQEVLGVEQVGILDNFFDLGGESFTAYRLMARITEEFDFEIPLIGIFQASTIASLEQYIKDYVERDVEKSLVLIQPGSSERIPFFCVHPAGGDVLIFQHLAQQLGEDQPFYGIQSLGRFLEDRYHATLEDMATFYIKEMKEVQPTGPYQIGGHSMGGVVAVEIARQLESMGEEVNVMAIFDAGIQKKKMPMLDTLLLVSDTFGLGLSREYLGQFEGPEMMNQILKQTKKRFSRVLEIAYDMDLLPRGFRTKDAELFLNRIATNIDLMAAYVPQPFHSRVTMFLASEVPDNAQPPNLDAWRSLALGGMDVIKVPGNHLNLVKMPHVKTLATHLRKILDKSNDSILQPKKDSVHYDDVTIQ